MQKVFNPDNEHAIVKLVRRTESYLCAFYWNGVLLKTAMNKNKIKTGRDLWQKNWHLGT